jgi:amino acid transporter
MISIGGVIGTGLFLGTGGALANGGPLGLLLGYTIMGSVCLCVMVGLGEMCSYLPIEGGHVALAHRFGTFASPCAACLATSWFADPLRPPSAVDPAWAFALSFNYAYNWLIILPVELAAVAILVGYWTTSINNAVWISIAMVVVIIINLFGSRGYGEAEFWFASIKVLTIIGLIFVGIIINAGYGDQGYLGFTYWKNPGPFAQYQGIAGTLGQFLGFWAVLIQAAFSFIGTEIVAIASGETENPRRNLPKAIKRVYIRILLFYILGVFIIGIITPSNSDGLSLTKDAASSPFVIAIEKAGIKVLPSIINACLITSAWSAGSSDMYTASRALYAIALNGDLPKVFLKTTKNGLPLAGLLTSVVFGCLAYLTLNAGPGKVFGWFANMTAIAGLVRRPLLCCSCFGARRLTLLPARLASTDVLVRHLGHLHPFPPGHGLPGLRPFDAAVQVALCLLRRVVRLHHDRHHPVLLGLQRLPQPQRARLHL